eukprot:4539375-Ditylum_brightwellii.AAC.1
MGADNKKQMLCYKGVVASLLSTPAESRNVDSRKSEEKKRMEKKYQQSNVILVQPTCKRKDTVKQDCARYVKRHTTANNALKVGKYCTKVVGIDNSAEMKVHNQTIRLQQQNQSVASQGYRFKGELTAHLRTQLLQQHRRPKQQTWNEAVLEISSSEQDACKSKRTHLG